MFKSGLTAIRPNEHLILNTEPNVYVNGEIAQYLLNHQINGIRFLYRNYQKQCSSILNDESGSGKCFQSIGFFDAILRADDSIRILVICHRKQSLDHWQFHVDCFLENINANIADNEKDTQEDSSNKAITIVSLDYVLNNLSIFTAKEFNCVILQDQRSETSAQAFTQLKDIKAMHKIALCSNDLMNDLAYLYELLKFCELKAPLKQTNNPNTILSLDEFKSKFGCKDDKSISKRNQVFRQCNLLNACNDFYQRRVCSQLGSQFPPISTEDFLNNFDAWKTITCDTVPLGADLSQGNDFSPIELMPAPNNRTLNTTNNEEVSILNVACTDFSDFDTQMSPLIYSDSEDSLPGNDHHHHSRNDDDDNGNNIENSQIINSQRLTPEIVCNQEHAAKIVCHQERAVTKEPVPSTSKFQSTTPIKRNHRLHHDKVSPASKRLNYKQLPIEIKSNANGRTNSESKTYLFRTKKQPCHSTQIHENEESQSVIKLSQNIRHRSTSSTSDIQIIPQKGECLSPIIISTSSEDLSQPATGANHPDEGQLVRETDCQSPDLFNSFISTKSEILSQQIANSQSSASKPSNKTETKTFRDVFGAPDECDDIDLLSNTNVDIFEITKNSVFDNVLCSASDRITPLKSMKSRTTDGKWTSSSVSCLSGIRIVLPKLDGNQVQQMNDNLSQSKIESQSSQHSEDSVVDLTLNESQRIVEISSEDSVRDVEKTPERKRELTPSTRSCLKRPSNDTSNTSENRRKSSGSRLGWLSTTRTSPRGCETPQSRRRLDKWKHRTDINNMKSDDDQKISRPRNLFKEIKSKSKPDANMRRNMPSTSTAASPSIFSDQE